MYTGSGIHMHAGVVKLTKWRMKLNRRGRRREGVRGEIEKWGDREMGESDRQTGRQEDRQVSRQTSRDGKNDRPTYLQTIPILVTVVSLASLLLGFSFVLSPNSFLVIFSTILPLHHFPGVSQLADSFGTPQQQRQQNLILPPHVPGKHSELATF